MEHRKREGYMACVCGYEARSLADLDEHLVAMARADG